MNDYDDTRPDLPKAVVEQWSRKAGEAPLQPPPLPPKKSAEERCVTRHEWREIFLCMLSVLWNVYLIYLTIEQLYISQTIYLLALFHPLLLFVFYHISFIEPTSRKGNQGIAFFLFLSSFTALLTALFLFHIHFLNPFSFLLPSILTALVLFLCNQNLKRKKGRYLSFLIMVIWVPFFMLAFPALCTITFPSLHTDVTEATIKSLDYDGNGINTLKASLQDRKEPVVFVITKQDAEILQTGDPIKIEIKQGILGISYMQFYPKDSV